MVETQDSADEIGDGRALGGESFSISRNRAIDVILLRQRRKRWLMRCRRRRLIE